MNLPPPPQLIPLDPAEELFRQRYPATHHRLVRCAGRRVNATAIAGRALWSGLLSLLEDRRPRRPWQGGIALVNGADEFGIADMYLAGTRGLTIITREGVSRTAPFPWTGAEALENVCVSAMWAVPFQQALLVQFQGREKQRYELCWIRIHAKARDDPSMWALNHNNLLEDPREFLSPPFLRGEMVKGAVFVAATEGRIDVPGKTAAVAVTMIGSQTLVFDQALTAERERPAQNWRELVTSELDEPVPVSASCFVLDAFLVMAGIDGVLRAHPRNNPQSVYHVLEMH